MVSYYFIYIFFLFPRDIVSSQIQFIVDLPKCSWSVVKFNSLLICLSARGAPHGLGWHSRKPCKSQTSMEPYQYLYLPPFCQYLNQKCHFSLTLKCKRDSLFLL